MTTSTTNTATTNNNTTVATVASAASALLKLVKGLNTLTTNGVNSPAKLRKEFLVTLRDDGSLSKIDKELLLIEFDEQQEILTGLIDQEKEDAGAPDKWWVNAALCKLERNRFNHCYQPHPSSKARCECGDYTCDGESAGVIAGKGVCETVLNEYWDILRNGK